MVKKTRSNRLIHCACVIHGNKYPWLYVERLFNMLTRNSNLPIQLHVYTEHDRSVPPHMIKHCLDSWPGIQGPKKSWWYKMHLFNQEHWSGPLLYFDLDTVIVRNWNWIVDHDPSRLWCIRDFKYLQSPYTYLINSSVMWFDTKVFDYVWQQFVQQDIYRVTKTYHGDQNFIQSAVDRSQIRQFDTQKFQSYRWEVLDGGMDFVRRRARSPGLGCDIAGTCTAVIFHGDPKPHQVSHPVIQQLWQ